MIGSLGYVTVTTAGTPVRATANRAAPGTHVGAQAVLFQAKPANTGIIYVGLKGMNKTTGVNVVGLIPAPADALAGPFPSFSPSQPLSFAGFSLEDLYLDADNSGEGVVVSYIQG